MGAIVAAGYAVVTRSGSVVAVMLTRKAARRRAKREGDCRVFELWFSSALQEES